MSFGLWMQKQGYRRSTVHYCIQALKSIARRANLLDPESVKTYVASADVEFHFAVTEPDTQVYHMDLGRDSGYSYVGASSATYVFTELISENPPGWVFRDIICERIAGNGQTRWEIEGASVTIYHDAADIVFCRFTNVGPSPSVGGYVGPVNKLALISPWLAVIGLVGCIGTVLVVAKKRRP